MRILRSCCQDFVAWLRQSVVILLEPDYSLLRHVLRKTNDASLEAIAGLLIVDRLLTSLAFSSRLWALPPAVLRAPPFGIRIGFFLGDRGSCSFANSNFRPLRGAQRCQVHEYFSKVAH